MGPTLVSATGAGQHHDQDVPKGPGDQVPLEFPSYTHPGRFQTPISWGQEFGTEIFCLKDLEQKISARAEITKQKNSAKQKISAKQKFSAKQKISAL